MVFQDDKRDAVKCMILQCFLWGCCILHIQAWSLTFGGITDSKPQDSIFFVQEMAKQSFLAPIYLLATFFRTVLYVCSVYMCIGGRLILFL